MAGFGGFRIGDDWLRQKRIKRKASRLRARYPDDLINKPNGFELVDTTQIPGKWWLIDKRDNTRHWIRNLESTRDFGWNYGQVRHIDNSKLEQYEGGEIIDTRDL